MTSIPSNELELWPLVTAGAKEGVRATLALVPMLAQAPPAIFERCVEAARLRRVPAGGVVVTRGNLMPGLSIVHSGEIELSMLGSSGRRYLCGVLKRGQVFGEIPALDGGMAVLTSTARMDSQVALIPRDVLLEALASDGRAAVALLINLARRTRFLLDLLGNQITLPLEGRVANMLLVIIYFQEQDGSLDRPKDINLSQIDLADILGCSRQALGPILKGLEASGMISLQYRHIEVLEPGRLLAMVNERRE